MRSRKAGFGDRSRQMAIEDGDFGSDADRREEIYDIARAHPDTAIAGWAPD